MDQEKNIYGGYGKVWVKELDVTLSSEIFYNQTFIIGENLKLKTNGVHIPKSFTEPEHYILFPVTHTIYSALKISWDIILNGKDLGKTYKYFEELKLLDERDVYCTPTNFQIKSISLEEYISVYGNGEDIKPAKR